MLFRSFFILLVSVLFASCVTYQTFNMDVLMPAKHTVQPEVKSVVLVDNSVPFRGKDVHHINTLGSELSIDTIWLDAFSELTLLALKEELQRRNFFDSVYLHVDPLKKDQRFINRALSWKQVDDLCQQYDAQAVVAVEKYLYGTKIQVERMFDGDLLGYLDAGGAILWRGYNNLSQKVIYRETQKDTISWDVTGGNITQIANGLPAIKGGLGDLAQYLGEQAADYLAPVWETQTRGYYVAGNYHFVQAAEFVNAENWGEAIKLWKYVFDHSQKKVKARAAYNLALAAEILSDYESALYWLKEGMSVYSQLKKTVVVDDRRRMVKYFMYMSKRVNSVEVLKEQIGAIQ
ncbi:DUF6340 family protein [Saccharicrinis fermentans]|uniref:Tetratricopeptide repeat protein n=1 Tax=Saccharicrinis fermentans DSM 9555 = JCM 21142 TaxID=869213 RepID=W7YK09_9BACT|nr:DUF6340 family protein [Saccharicrinis fermentans]GAF02664.1 hypothetical protein JCM21142_31303 [Saccharicrinis fermentans DSM 9555 = JCM 21142]